MQSTIDSSIITLVSVIAAGLVSILSVFVPVLTDSLKAKRQEKSDRTKEIDKATLDLLEKIAPFRHTDYNKIGNAGGNDPSILQSDLQAKHYAWERAVWPRLHDNDRDRVRKLRVVFETAHNLSEYTQKMQGVSDEILAVAYIATQRV
ncbi:MAG: hypothetical protein WA821_09725 [Anaerolineales bacterium]